MSDWDPNENVWDAESDQVAAPPGFASRPQRSPATVESQWDIPPVPTRPCRPRDAEAPRKQVTQFHEDWHKSVFPEMQRKGRYRNEHFDQLERNSQRDERREVACQASPPAFHGDLNLRHCESVTIAHRAPQRLVTNEHGDEEFHSEDLPVDPSLLQTTSTFRAAVDWAQLDVPDKLLGAIRRQNFAFPSKVQAHGLQLIRDEPQANLLVQAPTGSGKSLTFILGTLAAVDLADPLPQVMCVAPTNELLVQLTQQFATYAEALGVTVAQVSKTNKSANGQVLLFTPLQCINFFKARGASRTQLAHTKFLILDEADHLLNQDDQPEFSAHMETVIKEFLPRTTRVLLFSATYCDSVLQHISEVLDRGYTEIKVSKEELVLESIKMYYIQKSSMQGKIDLLVSVLREQVPGVTVVFVNTVKYAQVLFDVLNERGYKCALLIGRNMTTDERFKTLEDFKRGFYTVLLTTNVLARGIDNTHVARVVNYDIPVHWSTKMVDAETYLHRVGRSGRFNRPGIAITIVTSAAENHMLEEVKRYYGSTCVIEKIETDEEMREKVKQFAEEVALLDCETSA